MITWDGLRIAPQRANELTSFGGIKADVTDYSFLSESVSESIRHQETTSMSDISNSFTAENNQLARPTEFESRDSINAAYSDAFSKENNNVIYPAASSLPDIHMPINLQDALTGNIITEIHEVSNRFETVYQYAPSYSHEYLNMHDPLLHTPG